MLPAVLPGTMSHMRDSGTSSPADSGQPVASLDVGATGAEKLDAIVLAGGRGLRLGGASKADLDVGGRLLDRVLDAVRRAGARQIVVVAPDSVDVPAGVERTMEDPPGGGPLAGIGAGLDALDRSAHGRAGGFILVTSVDSPGIGLLAPRLVEAARAAHEAGRDGAIARGGEPEPFDQFLQGVYSAQSLRRALDVSRTANAGSLHDLGVRRVLCVLDLVRVEVGDECRDLDSPDDLDWWRGRGASSGVYR